MHLETTSRSFLFSCFRLIPQINQITEVQWINLLGRGGLQSRCRRIFSVTDGSRTLQSFFASPSKQTGNSNITFRETPKNLILLFHRPFICYALLILNWMSFYLQNYLYFLCNLLRFKSISTWWHHVAAVGLHMHDANLPFHYGGHLTSKNLLWRNQF